MFTSNRCKASIKPDRHPTKNNTVKSKTTRISLWLLHMTMSATNKIYADIPTDDNKFSAIKTSLKVPSDNTNARIHPIAKKHNTTNQ